MPRRACPHGIAAETARRGALHLSDRSRSRSRRTFATDGYGIGNQYRTCLLRQSLHLPPVDLAGGGVLPDEIVVAVVVKVGAHREAPLTRDSRRDETAANLRGVLQQPAVDVAVRGVPPEEVRVVVAVEIGAPWGRRTDHPPV